MIGQLSLRENDLDFRYLPALAQASVPRYAELRAVIDVSRFFNRGADHVVFALDCDGGQGSNNPHCGPVIRDGENLFATARGVVVAADGAVVMEIWNGTSSPGLIAFDNTLKERFDPRDHTCLNVRVRCHYAGGVEVRIRKGVAGKVLFEGFVQTAPHAWTGQMKACLGGIALGFVAPQETNCVEQLHPRNAAKAKLGYMAYSRLS